MKHHAKQNSSVNKTVKSITTGTRTLDLVNGAMYKRSQVISSFNIAFTT